MKSLNITIKEVMTTKIKTVKSTDKLTTVKVAFENNPFRHLPVVNKDRLVGIVSKTDFLRVTYGASLSEVADRAVNDIIYESVTVEKIMTTVVQALTPEHRVLDAAELFEKNKFHALPVVDRGKLVGIVSTTDLVSYLKKILVNRQAERASNLPSEELSSGNSVSNY